MWDIRDADLACDTCRGEAVELAVLIKEPAHHATASADLWPGYICVGPHH